LEVKIMSVPLGTIVPFYGDTNLLPIGYLVCNGTPFSKGQFSGLYFHLIAANPLLRIDSDRCLLPELRAEFLRGWDAGRNIDLAVDPATGLLTPRKLGSFQRDEFQKHKHEDKGHAHESDAAKQTGSVQSDNSDERAAPENPPKAKIEIGHADISDPVSSSHDDSDAVRTGRETRPRNIAIAFLIKAIPDGEERPIGSILNDLPEDVRQLLEESGYGADSRWDGTKP
jgi:hypothetical protein